MWEGEGGRIPLQTIIYIIYIYISIYLSISIYLYLYLYLYLSVYTVNNIAYCASRTSCAKVLELQCKCVSALFSHLSCFYLWLYIYIYREREREREREMSENEMGENDVYLGVGSK